jgi:TonB family protein
MALPVHFPPLGFPWGGEESMRLKVWLAGIGVALLLVGSAAVLMPKASAQESSTEVKRKVRSKVVPDYPPLAKQMNVTGKVKIETTIAADGHVVSTKVIGGSPLLVNAALDALKKWRFEPSAKDTTETIEFEFGAE